MCVTHIYIVLYADVYKHLYMYICMYVYVCVYIYMCVCVCVCLFVCVCVCLFVCLIYSSKTIYRIYRTRGQKYAKPKQVINIIISILIPDIQ